MTKVDQKQGLQKKSQAEAKVLADKLEITGEITDGILTVRIPLNVYSNDRGSLILGSSFGGFKKIAGAVHEDKDIVLSFTAVQSNR